MPTNNKGKRAVNKSVSMLAVVLPVALAAGLGYAVLSLPEQASGLADVVANHMDNSGVSHPVTAVLLNFRGYDTFLELVVLLTALLGVWSLAPLASQPQTVPAGPVLMALSRFLMPVMILVAGYLLWAGAHAPGGAFQAGSVLAAAGVLMLLCGHQLSPRLAGWPLRLGLMLGTVVFMAAGLAVMFGGTQFLQYPVSWAGGLILLIELAATLSIGFTLAALFAGNRPAAGENRL